MHKIYLINNVVIFYPEKHMLVPVKGNQGVETPLNIPASYCLLLLIERKNTVVSKEDFFDKAWEQRGTYVTPNTFYQNVSLLRRGLKNAGLAEDIIKTVPKRGLMLADNVEITLFDQEPNQVVTQAETIATARQDTNIAETLPILPAEPVSNEINVTRSKRNDRRWAIVSTLVFLSVVLAFFLSMEEQKKFFNDYKKNGEVNGCNLYLSAKERNITKYSNFITRNNIMCNSEQNVLFMTMDKSAEYISIIKCDSDSITDKSLCDSTFYAGEKNEN